MSHSSVLANFEASKENIPTSKKAFQTHQQLPQISNQQSIASLDKEKE
jgi:hypothetical protein